MAANEADTLNRRPRWYRLTPSRLLLVLLASEGFLWCSEWFRWLPWHRGYTVLTFVAAMGVTVVLLLLWLLVSLPFRRRFQFGIRSLLVLTAAIAVPCNWLAARLREARWQKEAVKALEELDGNVGYDYECDRNNSRDVRPPGPGWLREWAGEDFLADVCQVQLEAPMTEAGLKQLKALKQLRVLILSGTRVTDSALECVKGLTRLEELYLACTGVADAGLEHLKGLTQINTLDLSDTQVTDAGMEHLRASSKLRWLNLRGTHVTDAGVEHLKGFSQLEHLNLINTQVTDAGLEHLHGLSRLKWLAVRFTGVTEEGVKKLQQALPNCKIYR